MQIALDLWSCSDTFSAFWLRSSVVSVLTTVKSCIRDIVPVFFTLNFRSADRGWRLRLDPFASCLRHCTTGGGCEDPLSPKGKDEYWGNPEHSTSSLWGE